MGDAEPTTQIEEALTLVESVQDDPQVARDQARALLDRSESPTEALVVAHWAVGLAARQLNDLNEAEAELTAGLELAERHDLRRRVGQIRSSLSLVRLYKGETEQALSEAELAATDLTDGDLARNEMQIALILQRLGELHDALTRYENALAGLRAAGDRLAEARLLANRGVLQGYLGEIDAGVADLELALELGGELEQSLIVAACAHNLGFLEGRRGDIPAALEWFDRAEQAYDSLGRPPGMIEVLLANRAELLLSVGLFEEAAAVSSVALAGLEQSDNVTDLSETRLLAAEVALASGRPEEAVEHARNAATEFAQQEREGWRHLAEYAAVRARFAASDSELDSEAAAKLSASLDDFGLAREAQHCLLVAGRLALRNGETSTARTHLAHAAGARLRGPAVGRAQAWFAEALLRRAEGNNGGAVRAITAGLQVIRDYRLTLGAAELRSHAATHGLELARLATEMAIEAGSPWRVLRAVEDWRSVSRQVAAVRPPSDPGLVHLLSELRRVEAESREAALERGLTDALRSERARIERRIRSVERRRRGTGGAGDQRAWSRDGIVEAIGDRRLLSFFTYDGHIRVIVAYKGSAVMHTLMKVDRVRSELDSLLFSLNRLAMGSASAMSLAAAAETMDSRIASLRHGLLGDIELGEAPVTVIPSGVLHRLPWPALLPGMEVSVAPSLEAWVRAADRPTELNRDSDATLIAGPDLGAADREIALIAPAYARPRRLTGNDATAASALVALNGARVGHVAAHGTFRSDNPSFSSLQMSDGPLTVYDLQQMTIPPDVLVLSSCDTGVSKVVAGDELLGLSAALIDMGVGNLIAPVVPIPDEITPHLMADLHGHLAAGMTPSVALATVLDPGDVPSDQVRALRASFVCFGA